MASIYTVLMPTKTPDLTKQLCVRVTPEMYSIIAVMRRFYGSDADVLRAGVMSLWREFDALPSAEELPPTPDPGDVGDTAGGGE